MTFIVQKLAMQEIHDVRYSYIMAKNCCLRKRFCDCHCCDLSLEAIVKSSNYADILNVRSALGLSVTFALTVESGGTLFNQIGL